MRWQDGDFRCHHRRRHRPEPGPGPGDPGLGDPGLGDPGDHGDLGDPGPSDRRHLDRDQGAL